MPVSSLFKLLLMVCVCGYVGYDPASAQAQNLVVVAKGEKGKVVQVVVRSGEKTSLGSGFWINEDGYVATCLHVLLLDSPITIQVQSAVDSLIDLERNNNIDSNWESYAANLVAQDPVHDIAILKVAVNPFKTPRGVPIRIGNTALSAHYEKADLEVSLPLPGERTLIGGYPLGYPYLVFQEGTVASIAVPGSTPKILLSAVANHGNSGGPVFNDTGKVIGLLEGELAPAGERTGIEYVVPAFFLEKLMQGIQPPAPRP